MAKTIARPFRLDRVPCVSDAFSNGHAVTRAVGVLPVFFERYVTLRSLYSSEIDYCAHRLRHPVFPVAPDADMKYNLEIPYQSINQSSIL